MIVLGLTFGAIFMTMGWAYRTQIHSRNYRESRELLFNFVQMFDAMFRPNDITLNAAALEGLADAAFGQTVIMMAGAPDGIRRAQIRGFTIEVVPGTILNNEERILTLGILIASSGRALINTNRRFNATTNKTAQDWSEPN